MRATRSFVLSSLAPAILLTVVACADATSGPSTKTASPGVITTVAGGRPTYSGDGGLAIAADMNGPTAIALDARGALYIADALNLRLRRVDAAGTIATLAGTGVSGSSGDGGSATLAQLSDPSGVAVDANGVVYVADGQSNRVRAIDASGRISTRAGDGTAGFSGDGGASGGARLNGPADVAVDGQGNLYIADAGNNRVRRVDRAGTITTVAGSGTAGYSGDGGPSTGAELNDPLGIAIDRSGNLYIADEGNSRIRKVDGAGIITTVAGNGTAAFSGDGGPATQASLNHARAVVVDADGSIYIADQRNIRVRKVSASGVITTVAGNGQRGFAGDGGPATQAQLRAPHGLALDGAGNLLIADYGNNEVRKVDSRGTITRIAGNAPPTGSGEGGLATAMGLAHPRSVAADAAGNFYISDWNNNCVWKVNAQGIITTVAGTRAPGFSGDGGPGAEARLTAPHGIALDAAGNVYIADSNNHVRRVGRDGIITTVAGDGRTGSSGDGGPATQAAVGPPSGVALDAAGNLYISVQASHVVRRVSPAGIISTIAGTGTPGFSGDGGPATQAQMRFPIGIASDSAGNVYIAEQGNNRIRKVSAAGIISTVAGNGDAGSSGDGGPATAASLAGPFGVAVDRAGNVYATDSRNDRIRKIDVNGVITTMAGNGSPGFSGDGGPATDARLQGPHGVVVDAAGNILIADTANDRIRKVTPAKR